MRKVKFAPGNIYHIFNRGVEKRNIFNNDRDRWRFLQGLFLFNDSRKFHNMLYQLERNEKAINFNILREFVKNTHESRDPLITIMADCLMPNHYHLIVQEVKENGISNFMHKFGTGYVKYFNQKYNRVGSLFQGTFKAAAIENDIYLQYLLVYINVINPAQLIEPNLKQEGVKNIENVLSFAENYDWSTNKEYLNTRESIIIDKGLLGEVFLDVEKYKGFARDVLLSKKYNNIDHLTLE